jgi:hypothetical protein
MVTWVNPLAYSQARRSGRRFLTVLSFTILVLNITAIAAIGQDYQRGSYESGVDNIAPGEPLEKRFERRQLPIGARIGTLWIKPELQVDEAFDDNIFATQSARHADWITNFTGRSGVEYVSGSSHLGFEGFLTGHKYAVHATEDAWEGLARLGYEGEIHDDVRLVAGGAAKRQVDPRTDPTGLAGLTPTTYAAYEGYGGGLIGHAERNLFDLRANVNRIVYDSLAGQNGPIDTGDRDRTEVFGEGNFNHSFFGQQRVYVKIRPDLRIYDRKLDNNGFQRSSTGIRADLGGTLDLDSIIVVNLEAGYQQRDYDDPRFGAVGTPDVFLKASWWPSRLTSFNLNFTHEFYESFFTSSPGAVRKKVVAHLDHELRRRLLLITSVTFERDDLVKVASRFISETLDVKLQYHFADGFTAALDYAFTRQTAADATQAVTTVATGATNFEKSVVTLSIKKQF